MRERATGQQGNAPPPVATHVVAAKLVMKSQPAGSK